MNTSVAIFLVGYVCLTGACTSINEKTQSFKDCYEKGESLREIMLDNDVRKYFFACVNASDTPVAETPPSSDG